MTTTSIEIDRPAEQVYAYVTNPNHFREWQQGVVSGGIKEPGHAVGPTARWCGASAAPTDPRPRS